MKKFQEFIELKEADYSDFRNPVANIRGLIIGLGTRLRLLNPEEVGQYKDELVELRSTIDNVLRGI